MMKQTFQTLAKIIGPGTTSCNDKKNCGSSIDPEIKQVKPVKLVLCSAQFSGEIGRWAFQRVEEGRVPGLGSVDMIK